MPRHGETCQLCLVAELNLNEGKGEELTEFDHLEAFKFLAGASPNDNKTKFSKFFVCTTCSAKIRLISSLRSESAIVKKETDVAEFVDNDIEQNPKNKEEDLNLEELDQLSLYYAEHDDIQKDPDFAPKNNKKPIRKLVKRPKFVQPIVRTRVESKPVEDTNIYCQICSNNDTKFRHFESLKLHFQSIHGYKKEDGFSDGSVKDDFRITCQQCLIECETHFIYMSHVLLIHSGDTNSVGAFKTIVQTKLFNCDTCQRKFRRKTTLKSHRRNCSILSTENGSNLTGCRICEKDIIPSRMAAHQSFEHFCRICDDQYIFANRKEKCQHLEIVHKWWTKGKVKKALGEVACPREGCLQKFSRGSRKLKTHIKRDHEDLTGPKRLFECSECHALLKSSTCLRSHKETVHGSNECRTKCPYCEFSVGKWRKHSLYSCHIPAVHPEKAQEYIKDQSIKRRLWKEDYANRSKIQCFICDYAGSKASHLKRHYTEVHGYDINNASEDNYPDPEDPDGALCPECGQHFINKLTLIRHLLKEHSCPKGEQCLYCLNRYMDVRSHVNKFHAYEKDQSKQICKKCGEGTRIFSTFEQLLKHTRRYHRKGLNDLTQEGNEDDISTLAQISRQKNVSKKKKVSKRLKKKNSKLELDKEENTVGEGPIMLLGTEEHLNEESMDGFGCTSTGKRKKYIPQHLSGICPFCELKFSDLLGHIRHKCHEQCEDSILDDRKKQCSLCQEVFNSVRELVTHRQLHPQFKNHTCSKCGSEFETVVLLRDHRANDCPKIKKKKKKKALAYQQESNKQRQEHISKSCAIDESQIGNNLENTKLKETKSQTSTTPSNLSTLLMMVNDLNNTSTIDSPSQEEPKTKTIEYEGRGTVKCHICLKSFTIKSLLRRHYISHHTYSPDKVQADVTNLTKTNYSPDSKESCSECKQSFGNIHARIKHQLNIHSVISGEICPYCDCKWGWKKFDNLDEHVTKYHLFEMDSPIQSCLTCKTNFESYAALKKHRQLHEGNRRLVEINTSNGKDKELVTIHTRVGMRPEVENRGGVKCKLCSSFKLRKDQLKMHYIKEHGYIPKLADKNDHVGKIPSKLEDFDPEASFLGEEMNMVECNVCPETFSNNHALIKHLLKSHCSYTGLICPYCRDTHHPQRFIDLQAHVTNAHMDKLTGYGVSNECKLCNKSFTGYAELRDHVQIHGDMFREPAPNKELYKENARRRRREKRIDKQKQRQLATKNQNIFEVPKDISVNINKSKFTVLRKVTNEELTANNIRRLDTGKLIIEDQSLLAKSIIHFNKNANTGKQLMVPVKLHEDAKSGDNSSTESSVTIDMEEVMSPSSTTRQINFEDQIVQNDFGAVKVPNSYEQTDLVSPTKTEFESINTASKSVNFEMTADPIMIPRNLSKSVTYCPHPPPNTPPDEKILSLQTDALLSRPTLENESSDDDQGQTGIIVTNGEAQQQHVNYNNDMGNKDQNRKSIAVDYRYDKNSRTNLVLMKNAVLANVVRAIKNLKENNQNKTIMEDTSSGISFQVGNLSSMQSNKYEKLHDTSHISARKKDLILSCAENMEGFEQLSNEKVKKDKLKFEGNEESDLNLNNGFDPSINSINSQTAAAEKFQQISSPFSVAALLAAAELDEELAAHSDDQQ